MKMKELEKKKEWAKKSMALLMVLAFFVIGIGFGGIMALDNNDIFDQDEVVDRMADSEDREYIVSQDDVNNAGLLYVMLLFGAFLLLLFGIIIDKLAPTTSDLKDEDDKENEK